MFLSCLCGSEHKRLQAVAEWAFLSCLCGSEQKVVCKFPIQMFLSCLCGSELFNLGQFLRQGNEKCAYMNKIPMLLPIPTTC